MVTGAPFASATTALTCCMYELLQAGAPNHPTRRWEMQYGPPPSRETGRAVQTLNVSISDRADFVTDLRGSPSAGLAALGPPSDHSSISDRARGRRQPGLRPP